MAKEGPRVLAVVKGDIVRQAWARTKFGCLFQAMADRFQLVEVYDARLRGMDRLINMLITIHPHPRRWRQRFYMNVPAFRVRSQRVAAYLHSKHEEFDVVFQMLTLFDACWGNSPFSSVMYCDYTAALSAQRPDAGRSPLTPRQLKKWMALEREAYERARHICTWSDVVRSSLIADYQLAPERVTTIGGGVNFAELPELSLKRDSEEPTALFIGQDFYRKGGDLLLRAFAITRAQLPDARLLLLTRDEIPADLPLEGVEVIAPTWDRAKIKALYRRADLFVLPSRLETWGDVLLEAMAYGLPCIGVAGQAMAEIIQDGKTGQLVMPDDVESLAAALTKLLGNQALREQWGIAARQKIENELTWQKVVERLAPIILNLEESR